MKGRAPNERKGTRDKCLNILSKKAPVFSATMKGIEEIRQLSFAIWHYPAGRLDPSAVTKGGST